MGRHVDKVEERMRAEGRYLTGEEGLFSGKTTCPFTTGVLEESQSLFEVLMHDDRASHELAINLVMALLRTGIDSVRRCCTCVVTSYVSLYEMYSMHVKL